MILALCIVSGVAVALLIAAVALFVCCCHLNAVCDEVTAAKDAAEDRLDRTTALCNFYCTWIHALEARIHWERETACERAGRAFRTPTN
jgi:hypothetical protein